MSIRKSEGFRISTDTSPIIHKFHHGETWVIHSNKPSEWYYTLGKSSEAKFYVSQPPNMFHRFMQKKFLGVYWHKMKEVPND